MSLRWRKERHMYPQDALYRVIAVVKRVVVGIQER